MLFAFLTILVIRATVSVGVRPVRVAGIIRGALAAHEARAAVEHVGRGIALGDGHVLVARRAGDRVIDRADVRVELDGLAVEEPLVILCQQVAERVPARSGVDGALFTRVVYGDMRRVEDDNGRDCHVRRRHGKAIHAVVCRDGMVAAVVMTCVYKRHALYERQRNGLVRWAVISLVVALANAEAVLTQPVVLVGSGNVKVIVQLSTVHLGDIRPTAACADSLFHIAAVEITVEGGGGPALLPTITPMEASSLLAHVIAGFMTTQFSTVPPAWWPTTPPTDGDSLKPHVMTGSIRRTFFTAPPLPSVVISHRLPLSAAMPAATIFMHCCA